MKKINIITSLSPQQQYSLRRWFYISTVALCTLTTAGMYFLIPQIFLYVTLKKEIAVWHSKISNNTIHMNAKETLKKEYDELRLRNAKVDGYIQQLKNPYTHFMYISSMCIDGIQLESIRLNKKEIEIIIQCNTDMSARTFVKALTQSSLFSQVKIVSLQRNDASKKLTCTIKAYVIF